MSDLYYPNWFSEADKARIRRSSIWSVLLTLYYNSGGKLLLLSYDDSTFPHGVMGFQNGLKVVGVETINTGEIKISPTHDITDNNCNYRQTFVESLSPKYIALKLRSVNDGPGKDLAELIKSREEDGIDYILRPAVMDFAKAARKTATYNTAITIEQQEWALRVLFDSLDKTLIPKEQLDEMKAAHVNLHKNENNQKKFLNKATEMLGREKWIVGYVDKTIIAGLIQTNAYIDGAVQLSKNGYFPMGIRPTEIIPLRKYKSIPEVDPAFRDELSAALAFCKVNREAGGKRAPALDEQGFLPIDTGVYEDVGAISWRPTNTSTWFMCDKLH